MSDIKKTLAVAAVTFTLVVFGLVMHFGDAANSVAVFQTEGNQTDASYRQVGQLLNNTAGVSASQFYRDRGLILTVFDSRSVDPRSIAASLTRIGFPTRINEIMTMKEYNAIISGDSGCGKGSCDNCSK